MSGIDIAMLFSKSGTDAMGRMASFCAVRSCDSMNVHYPHVTPTLRNSKCIGCIHRKRLHTCYSHLRQQLLTFV
uniref:Uncharacterized protein n=1 Tax=Callorhinchus milii TaxID=7868 RepID=A0A4W3H7Y8_CALMI